MTTPEDDFDPIADDGETFEDFLAEVRSSREKSIMAQIVRLPKEERDKALDGVDPESLLYSWESWARPSQILPETGYSTAVIMAGRGWGKRLDVDTPIPTPSGWTRMGDLVEGDEVFSHDGSVCRVTEAHPIVFAEDMFRITFDDGASLIADAGHLWETQTGIEYKRQQVPRVAGLPGHRNRLRPSLPTSGVRTTAEILNTLDQSHTVRVALPLETGLNAQLPCDPYTLGAWLGDGTSTSSIICGVDDEIFSRISEAYSLTEMTRDPRCPHLRSAYIGWEPPTLTARGSVRNGTFNRALADLGLFGNKRIPQLFLRASYQDRLALLQGIMDTDGSIEKNGSRAGITQVSHPLANDIYELLTSLGYKVRRATRMKGVAGQPSTKKPCYVLTFRPDIDRPPFSISRKTERLVKYSGQRNRQHTRMIKKIERVTSRQARCISVDSARNLYLAGKAMIPTHNTRVGSEWVRHKAQTNPGCRILLLARTSADVRDTMVLGESGILAVHPPGDKPEYKPSTRSIVWKNGSQAILFSDVEPDQLRGPQGNYAWADEIATYNHQPDASGLTAWKNLRIATRLGSEPQVITTTTPKRVPVIEELLEETSRPGAKTLLRRGRTIDNEYLALSYLELLWYQYKGTALWRQEIEGELIGDIEGALWDEEVINGHRVNALPPLPRRVVAVDPSVAETPRDECGIVVVGATAERKLHKRHAYVLEDASLLGSPTLWAQEVVRLAKKWRCPVVAEGNQGQTLVKMAIQSVDPTIPVYLVNARQNKKTRAEPVSVAYQAGRVHHKAYFPVLESQLTTWIPETSKKSPDRLDALVWGVTALLIAPPKGLAFGGPVRAKSSAAATLGVAAKRYAGHLTR